VKYYADLLGISFRFLVVVVCVWQREDDGGGGEIGTSKKKILAHI
jgi:hypothetical protein